jgi:hypothetical protein
MAAASLPLPTSPAPTFRVPRSTPRGVHILSLSLAPDQTQEFVTLASLPHTLLIPNHSPFTNLYSSNREVDVRLHGKEISKIPWRKAGQARHLVDVQDSDQ